MTRYPAVVVVVALLALQTAGCGGSEEPAPSAIQWIDGTGSAKGESIPMCTKRAREVTEQVAREQGTATVERLDASTANAPTFQATKKFDIPAEIASDPGLIQEKRRDDVAALYRTIAPRLAAPAAGHTEIVGALAASGAKLRGHSGDRLIWVCGDMIDSRLRRLDAIDQPSVERLLEKMHATGEIPQMHGARVVLDTTSAVARDSLGPREQAAVEFFYRSLIEEGGGELVSYAAGANLPLD